jgi:hypothetical protein
MPAFPCSPPASKLMQPAACCCLLLAQHLLLLFAACCLGCQALAQHVTKENDKGSSVAA